MLYLHCAGIIHHDDESNQKYAFLGEATTHAAIRFILVKHYAHLNHADLVALSKKFSSLIRLHKVINEEIHLRDYVYSSQLSDTLNSIIGVLMCFYDIDIVAKFIESAVLHVISLSANNPPLQAGEENTNPIYLLHQKIRSQNGYFSDTASLLDGLWHVELKCKMTDKSTLFSHARNGTSKQRAKTAAAQDILNYLKQHPDQLTATAAVPGVYRLPIGSSSQTPATWEYYDGDCVMPEASTTHTLNSSNSSYVEIKEEEEDCKDTLHDVLHTSH